MDGSEDQSGLLAPASNVLSPLPLVLRHGLTAVAILASFSLFAASVTVIYLTFKFVRWYVRNKKRAKSGRPEPSGVDLSLGLAPIHFGDNGSRSLQGNVDKWKPRPPNQFLVLLYSLLVADMHQAGAFLINAAWVSKNSIQVGSPGCFFQGWLISTGDLSSGLFLSAIAIHSYLSIVRNYKPPQWAVYSTVVGIWVSAYFLSALGIATTRNGHSGGGYFVRAGAWVSSRILVQPQGAHLYMPWEAAPKMIEGLTGRLQCWINLKYENMRLLTHYLFLFVSLVVVSVLYTLIFLTVRRRQNQSGVELSQSQSRLTDQSQSKSSLDFRTKNTQSHSPPTTRENHSGHHPAFLIYPIIYVVCTAPLALGRIATMAGASVPLGYFCAAGALITSNGWLDVLLWGLTRRVLLFESDIDAEEVGLDTFAFMRTPPGRKFGNMVWVQGAASHSIEDGQRTGSEEARDGFDWWGWRPARSGRRSAAGHHRMASLGPQTRGHKRIGSRSISQESLRGRGEMAIQMDVVTSVEVEMDADRMGRRHRDHSLSSTPDKEPQLYDSEHNLKFMHERERV
jgi:hypothetical protein